MFMESWVFVSVKFPTLVTQCGKGNDSIYRYTTWPRTRSRKKKNGERILGDLDHQRNKNKSLRETLSTSFYSPSPVKEDQRLTKRFRMTLLNIVGQSLWYGMIIHIPKRSRTDLWIRSDATFQKYYIHLHHLKREFCFEKTDMDLKWK